MKVFIGIAVDLLSREKQIIVVSTDKEYTEEVCNLTAKDEMTSCEIETHAVAPGNLMANL